MAGYGARKSVESERSHLYLLKNEKREAERKPDAALLQSRQRNRDMNLHCGVDVERLEQLRKEAGLFTANLAVQLGISVAQLREYISLDKSCPVSFAQNWELTILHIKRQRELLQA